MLEEINPDLIILGTEVPMTNGYLPLTLISKETHKPIMVVGHREELVYMLELGADRFVSKPLDNSLFMATIHSLLRRYCASYAISSFSRDYLTKCSLFEI